jgi:excisionase family DNA binding protein
MAIESLLTLQEASAFLRISASYLYHLAECREIEHFRFGRRILFSSEQIAAFIEKHAVGEKTA